MSQVMRRRFAGAEFLIESSTPWTPLNMATVPQIYLDAQDSVVTDVSGFASAISNLGAMGADGDFLQATAGNRPTILAAELNGQRVLSFDGATDVLFGGSVPQKDLFRNKGSAWIFTVHKKRSTDVDAQFRAIFSASTATGAPDSRFTIYQGAGASTLNKPRLLVKRLDADAYGIAAAATGYSGSYLMMFTHVNYSLGSGQVQVNASVIVDAASLTTAGSTSDTASINSLALGAYHTGSVNTDLDLAVAVISNTAPSLDDIDRLHGWAAHKYGLTADLPVDHPYKTVAPTV